MLRDKTTGRIIADKRFAKECYACGTGTSKRWAYNHGTTYSLCIRCYDWLRGTTGLYGIRRVAKKQCFVCGSTTTRAFKKKNESPYYPWFYNYDVENNVLCYDCYRKHIYYPISQERTRGRRLVFLNKNILLPYNPKKGICEICKRSISKGEIKKTDMHHKQYDPDNPLAHTVELCVNCHNHKHPRQHRR